MPLEFAGIILFNMRQVSYAQLKTAVFKSNSVEASWIHCVTCTDQMAHAAMDSSKVNSLDCRSLPQEKLSLVLCFVLSMDERLQKGEEGLLRQVNLRLAWLSA